MDGSGKRTSLQYCGINYDRKIFFSECLEMTQSDTISRLICRIIFFQFFYLLLSFCDVDIVIEIDNDIVTNINNYIIIDINNYVVIVTREY